MADEHDTGEGSHAVELAQIREIVKEEVAKALQATIPTHMDGMQASLLDSIRQEFATLKASGDIERPSRKEVEVPTKDPVKRKLNQVELRTKVSKPIHE
ncbi:hypothetical protein E3N88_34827 [Mikania micrantha]|uniref:Uncharacterized protein n=1 Tax=Mikania micrantha TaxID=192012 RepID=A0A5N6LZ94_9ASTR|nr:hypothetical protein E3N88_34827 [Mikania micrantha]